MATCKCSEAGISLINQGWFRLAPRCSKVRQSLSEAVHGLLMTSATRHLAFCFLKVETESLAARTVLQTGQTAQVCGASGKRSTCSPLVSEKTLWVGYLAPGRAFIPLHIIPRCSSSATWLSVVLHHWVVVAVDACQDGVVEWGRRAIWAFSGAIGILTALAAEDLLEGCAHLLVSVGVDDGVHGRVELCQEQEEFFICQDIALGTANIKEQQD